MTEARTREIVKELMQEYDAALGRVLSRASETEAMLVDRTTKLTQYLETSQTQAAEIYG